MMISEAEFDEKYRAMDVSKHGDQMAPTYRDALVFATENNLSEQHIWAITEGDEDDSLYANPGAHLVNVIGYVVTENPWESEDLVAMYFEDESEDLAPAPGM
ncbi:MAG: hypothetical protein SWN10_23785 [Pseudomonadota bacterium]|nr:hypothetical protein [Pseudomonadota bacterium]